MREGAPRSSQSGMPAGKVSVFSEVHFLKAASPMWFRPAGSVSSTRAEKPTKVPVSILESAAGRVSLTRRLQPLKAESWR